MVCRPRRRRPRRGKEIAMRFEIPIVPPTVTAQHKGAFYNKKLGRIMFFTKKEVQHGENTLYSVLEPHRPAAPIKGAVKLLIQWHFPYRKSEKKGIIGAGRPIWRIGRPDLDNLEKSFLDVMTRLQFWEDDSQIAWKQTLKFWDKTGKLVVDVAPAPELAPEKISMEQLELGQLLGI